LLKWAALREKCLILPIDSLESRERRELHLGTPATAERAARCATREMEYPCENVWNGRTQVTLPVIACSEPCEAVGAIQRVIFGSEPDIATAALKFALKPRAVSNCYRRDPQ